ncbi:uncharacterized protein LOC118420814 [Branchiostoma floridae]|uniref:Netrin receptor UNC5 n=1 Tax=Branchiostoma floridae TaxID=7739 RepID=A0A9J7LIS3_BRAFL|nr:uncharacterized protein LOC118420814 [Branchiostoma floridae]
MPEAAPVCTTMAGEQVLEPACNTRPPPELCRLDSFNSEFESETDSLNNSYGSAMSVSGNGSWAAWNLPFRSPRKSEDEDWPKKRRSTFLSKWLDTSGGELELPEVGVRLNVPMGAVPEGETIQVYLGLSWHKDYRPVLSDLAESLLSPTVYFGPHFGKLNLPATLVFPHSALVEEDEEGEGGWKYRVCYNEGIIFNTQEPEWFDTVGGEEEIRPDVDQGTVSMQTRVPGAYVLLGREENDDVLICKRVKIIAYLHLIRAKGMVKVKVYCTDAVPGVVQVLEKKEATRGTLVSMTTADSAFYNDGSELRVRIRHNLKHVEEHNPTKLKKVISYKSIWHQSSPFCIFKFTAKEQSEVEHLRLDIRAFQHVDEDADDYVKMTLRVPSQDSDEEGTVVGDASPTAMLHTPDQLQQDSTPTKQDEEETMSNERSRSDHEVYTSETKSITESINKVERQTTTETKKVTTVDRQSELVDITSICKAVEGLNNKIKSDGEDTGDNTKDSDGQSDNSKDTGYATNPGAMSPKSTHSTDENFNRSFTSSLRVQGMEGVSYTSRMVDARGAVLRLPSCGAELLIPPKAIPDGEQVLILLSVSWDTADRPRLEPAQSLIGPVVLCGPSGVQLQKAATLVFEHCGLLNSQSTPAVLACEEMSIQNKSWRLLTNDAEKDDQNAVNVRACFLKNKCIVHMNKIVSFAPIVRGSDPGKTVRFVAFGPQLGTFEDVNIRVYCINDTADALECIRQQEGQAGRRQCGGLSISCMYPGDNCCVQAQDPGPGWAFRGLTQQQVTTDSVWRNQFPVRTFVLCHTDHRLKNLHFRMHAYQERRPDPTENRMHAYQERRPDPTENAAFKGRYQSIVNPSPRRKVSKTGSQYETIASCFGSEDKLAPPCTVDGSVRVSPTAVVRGIGPTSVVTWQ